MIENNILENIVIPSSILVINLFIKLYNYELINIL